MILSDVLTIAIVVAVWLAVISLLWLGWTRRRARQAPAIGTLPSTPDDLGALASGPYRGVYVGSTFAPDWLARVAVGDWGFRAVVNLSRYPEGYLLERGKGDPLWIADDALVHVRTDSRVAGKVMPGGGLLVLRWILPTGAEIDTGFRGDDRGHYPDLIAAAPLAKGNNS